MILRQGSLEKRNTVESEFERESDRGCAILSACLLEESLSALFAAALPDGEKAARHFMPRGRLSAGVSNAHAIGLIDEATMLNLRLVLEVRNTFAHGLLSSLSFESESVRNKVYRLALPNMDEVPEARLEIEGSPRRRFLTAVDALYFTLETVAAAVRPLSRVAGVKWIIKRRTDRLESDQDAVLIDLPAENNQP